MIRRKWFLASVSDFFGCMRTHCYRYNVAVLWELSPIIVSFESIKQCLNWRPISYLGPT